MRELPEFGDIPEEEDRRAAYEKFIKRQKVCNGMGAADV